VLILRDVLGFSARETADALDTKPTSVNSVLQRGHKTVDARLPEQNQQAALRSLGDTELREIVDGYIEAWERADIDSVVAMLAEEVTLDVPHTRTGTPGATRSQPSWTLTLPPRETAGAWFPPAPTGSWRSATTSGGRRPTSSSQARSACSRCGARRSRASRSSATRGALARFGLPDAIEQ
jgi:hypothetical protein